MSAGVDLHVIGRGFMTARATRAVRFARAKLEHPAPGRTTAVVELQGAAATYVGRAEVSCVDGNGLWATAQATTRALRDLGHSVEIECVDVMRAFGEPAVVVRVTAELEGETRHLIGLGLVGVDGLRAASVAVLDATNRFLEIG